MKKQLAAIDVENYLNNLDRNFIPQLSTIVNIHEYSRKLADNADHFCLFDENELIGFIAMYCNNLKSKTAFISSVSIHPNYTGRGLAKKLLREAVRYAKDNTFQQIQLEVDYNNAPATNLYKSLGFEITNKDETILLMTLKI